MSMEYIKLLDYINNLFKDQNDLTFEEFNKKIRKDVKTNDNHIVNQLLKHHNVKTINWLI